MRKMRLLHEWKKWHFRGKIMARMYGFRCEEEDVSRLDFLCKKAGVTRTAMLNDLIRGAVAVGGFATDDGDGGDLDCKLSVRLSGEDRGALEALAGCSGGNVSDLVRAIVRRYLAVYGERRARECSGCGRNGKLVVCKCGSIRGVSGNE